MVGLCRVSAFPREATCISANSASKHHTTRLLGENSAVAALLSITHLPRARSRSRAIQRHRAKMCFHRVNVQRPIEFPHLREGGHAVIRNEERGVLGPMECCRAGEGPLAVECRVPIWLNEHETP